MRTFIYIIASVIVALSLLIFNEASPQGFPNKSLLEPVIVDLGAIAPLDSVPINQIRVFAYSDTTQSYKPVPFQIDEKKGKEYFNIANGIIDEDDELVVFASDFGSRIPAYYWVDKESEEYPIIELALSDTSGLRFAGSKYLYIFVSAGAPKDSSDYISYDPINDSVSSLYYASGADLEGLWRDLSFNPSQGGDGVTDVFVRP